MVDESTFNYSVFDLILYLGLYLGFIKVFGIYMNQFSVIVNLKVIDWPLNDTDSLFSFFSLTLILDIKSSVFIIYHCTPPRHYSIYL